jgi:hypothetical protein
MFVVHLLVILVAIFLIGTALWDLFETVVLPRRYLANLVVSCATYNLDRPARRYTRGLWPTGAAVATYALGSSLNRRIRLAAMGPWLTAACC